MKRLGMVCAAVLVGCLVAAAIQWQDRIYVSMAAISEAPTYSFDDADLTNTELSRRLRVRINDISQNVLSRKSLTEMILKLDLYPEESRTVPMEDLIERCRTKAIQISSLLPRKEAGDKEARGYSKSFVLSFRHKDPQLAMAATKFLTSRFLTANISLSVAAAEDAVRFLSQWEAAAEQDLAAKEATMRTVPSPSPRAMLDLELARQHCARLRDKAASVGLVNDVTGRSLGPRLELLDAATEPGRPFVEWWPALGWGAGAGLAAGLLIINIPFLLRVKLRHAIVAAACAAACVIVSAFPVYLLNLHPFHSEAVVAIKPGLIPRSVLADDPEAVPKMFATSRVYPLSWHNLTNVISNYHLYPRQVKSWPLAKVIEQMREDAQITTAITGESGYIRFTTWGSGLDSGLRFTAQKVAQDLTARLLSHYRKLDHERAALTLDELERAGEDAAKRWDEAMHATGPNPARIALDRDLAKKRYMELKQKGLEAGLTVAKVEEPYVPPSRANSESSRIKGVLNIGPMLEMVDPASLPTADYSDLDRTILAASGLLGAIAGLIWKRPRVA